jgi:hypothetical protein
MYDGVVAIGKGDGLRWMSGALIRGLTSATGNYILTAAHVAKEAGDVFFDMSLFGRLPAIGAQPILGQTALQITIPARVGDGYGIYHSAYDGSTHNWDYDIGILRLVDPISPAPDRFLVPPRSAQAYQPYPFTGSQATEMGRTTTFVGYGDIGIGETGGTPSDGRKRLGQNQIEPFDRWPVGEIYTSDSPKVLLTDFDNGSPQHDAFGVAESWPGLGLGPQEATAGGGDSGGPWFATDNQGTEYIVGVHAKSTRFPNSIWYTQPDWDGANGVVNNTFGEVDIATRVGSHYSDFILPNTSVNSYDLVLDMNYQVYGQSHPIGGGTDDLTITVRKEPSGNLVIEVTDGGLSGGLNGVYYTANASQIRSLTIRGSGQNETFRIVGDLGIQGDVYIDGRGGINGIIYDDTGLPADARAYTFADNVSPGYSLRLNRLSGGQLKAIDSKDVSNYTLRTSNGSDTVAVDYMPSTLANGMLIETNGGNDDIWVGTSAAGMTPTKRPLTVDAGTGEDKITFRDGANNTPNMSYTIDRYAPDPNWGYTLYRTKGVPTDPDFEAIPNIHFRLAEDIQLDTGSQGDSVQIVAAPPVTPGILVNTGSGGDTVYVGSNTVDGMANVVGPVAIHLGSQALDHMIFEDTLSPYVGNQYTLINAPASNTYELYRHMNGVFQPTIIVAGAKKYTLNASMHDDLIGIQTAPAAATAGVFVNGNAGNDTITVGELAIPGLDKLLAPVTVNGNAGDDTLIVDNRGALPKNISVYDGAVSRIDGRTVSYEGVNKIEIKSDGGAANVNIQEKAAGVDVKVSFENGANAAPIGNGVLAFELGGGPNWITVTTAGNQVSVGGTLSVSVLPALTAAVGDVFTLVDNQTDQPVAGIFDTLPEGVVLSVAGWQFRVSYLGQQTPGDPYANDVTLTVVAVPPPPPPPPPTGGTITGRVWHDVDADGIQDEGEVGLTGVVIRLLDLDGNVVAETTPFSQNGDYRFMDVAPGQYRIWIDPVAWSISPRDQGTDDDIDCDFSSSGYSDLLTVTAGSLFDIDAGVNPA